MRTPHAFRPAIPPSNRCLHVFRRRRLSAPALHSPADVYTRLMFSNNNSSISSYPISLCLYLSLWHMLPFLSLCLKVKHPIKKRKKTYFLVSLSLFMHVFLSLVSAPHKIKCPKKIKNKK